MIYVCKDCGSHDIIECDDCKPSIPVDYAMDENEFGIILDDKERKILDNEFER